MISGPRLGVAAAIATLAVALVAASSASALYVKGHQVATNPAGTKFDMTGGLVGKWKITSLHVKHTNPVLKVKGTEAFAGCIDAARDGSCVGDPTGTLDFRFRYWARFTDAGVVELGTCAHRVTAGSGGFLGATGFLMMVDTPVPGDPTTTTTHYEGEIDAPGLPAKGAATAPGC